MASVTVSHLIIFIASMVVAAGAVGTFTAEVGSITSAIDDEALDVSSQLRTDVEIISDSGSAIWNANGNENITVYVKNVGSRQLPAEPGLIDVFVDGKYQDGLSVTVVDGTYWRETNVVEITFDYGTLSDGDHRLKIVVNGDEDVLSFRKNP